MNHIILNGGQKKAVYHKGGPMLVIAGPGSGKTTVIVWRIEYLIRECGVSQEDILVITFTKAAAEEMKSRLRQSLGGMAFSVTISTFHALFFRILKAHTEVHLSSILSEEERLDIIKQLAYKAEILKGYDEDAVELLAAEISLVKNDLINLDYYNSMSVAAEDFKIVLTLYEDYKKAFKKLDFDDMLEKCYTLLFNNPGILAIWQERYQYIMVDEFQDINKAQYNVLKLLSARNENLYIVGDDDQSIYRFRGARPEFLLNFRKDYPAAKTAFLDVNYRSSEGIIGFGAKIINGNNSRFYKSIKGTGKAGPKPVLIKSDNTGKEAYAIAKKILALPLEEGGFDEICVLYRINDQSRPFIDAFINMSVPFRVKEGAPLVYEHWVARDMISYLVFALDRANDEAFRRIANKPNRYISNDMLRQSEKMGMGLLDYLYSGILKQWQLKRIEELMFYLNAVKRRQPYDAIKYIRQAVGYDGYIEDYAGYRKISPKGLLRILDELLDSAQDYETINSYLQHIQATMAESKKRDRKKQQDHGVLLSTIHGAKGLEFETVFVASCVEGLIPYEKSRTASEIEEERRLFYVAVTRAKKNLYISCVNSIYDKNAAPSRFL